MRRLFLVLLFAFTLLPASAQRYERSINDNWSFHREGEELVRVVSLPHTWNAQDCTDDEPGYWRGVGWYEKTVQLNDDLSGRKVFVRFEGANQEVNLARASVNGEVPTGFPLRLGIMGDSISTFEGKIPSGHRTYYPKSDCDVTDWTMTYWGLLATQYWKCELDVNTSWSGSCVAADPRTGSSYRKPFVDRVNLFQNPDVIILFGGTNDINTKNGVGLGEFNYDKPLDQMDTYCRFRDAYIFVIRSLQKNYPAAQIICIIGTDITGDYGASVETIAKHYNLPYVDFRGEKNDPGKVSIYVGSHPDAAGHAYKARKIYEETLSLFQ